MENNNYELEMKEVRDKNIEFRLKKIIINRVIERNYELIKMLSCDNNWKKFVLFKDKMKANNEHEQYIKTLSNIKGEELANEILAYNTLTIEDYNYDKNLERLIRKFTELDIFKSIEIIVNGQSSGKYL